ncbi:type I restriction enzyme M protein [Micromonospora viridifaciens]|uniref:Type I restriction enzyme M protein n=1 Tax=Micromonospora viridifaciens TaxID=1881 RepID=A0A1C4ZTE5_MICVI|nr:N-6 DNA methylase [Micromonospora viridifaciens]SCF36136.1 type I restriction enzyme M protein [Micromonospora viridifaciens]
MPDGGESLVSRADIARLAEVHRPAVANWERRYPDFPQPVKILDGIERFSATDVGNWLASRRIPSNARSASEPDDCTYGDRFRRNLGSDASLDCSDVSRSLIDRLADLKRVNAFRGVLEAEEYRDLLLALVHAMVRRPVAWEALRVASRREDDAFFPSLQNALTGSEIGPLTELSGMAVLTPRHLMEARDIVRLLADKSDWPQPEKENLGRHLFAGLLERFAQLEGKRAAGEFHTPSSVTRLAARILGTMGTGRSLFDPYCRSGEFLVAVLQELTSHVGVQPGRVRIFASHPRVSTCRLAELHLDMYDVDRELRAGLSLADHKPSPPGYDLVVSNPPFNMRLGEGLVHSRDWGYAPPPPQNANFAWLQHALLALNEKGAAALVVANNACFSSGKRDREIRKAMVEDGVVACLVALPPQLFSGTAVPSTLWILDKRRRHSGEVLFLDATSLGAMTSRTSRVLTDDDIARLTRAFAIWWAGEPGGRLDDMHARAVPLAEIRSRSYSLNPLSYVNPPRRTASAEERTDELRRISRELEQLRASAEAVSRAASLADAGTDVAPAPAPQTRNTLIGDVPIGWRQLPLGQLAEIQAGPHLPRALPGVGVPLVQPRNLRYGAIATDDLESVSVISDASIHRYALRPGDLLCVRAGDLGRHGMVGAGQSGWLFGTGLFRIRPSAEILPEYLAHYLGLVEVVDWIRRNASGTAVPSINRETLAELPVVLPSLDEQGRIARVLQDAWVEARVHDQLAKVADRLRENLAPMLMRGAKPTV